MKRRWVPTALILVLAALALPAAAAPAITGPRDITQLKNGDRLTDAEAAAIFAMNPGLAGASKPIPAAGLRTVKNGHGVEGTAIQDVQILTVGDKVTAGDGPKASGIPSNEWCRFNIDVTYREGGGTAFMDHGRCSNASKLYPTRLQIIWYKQPIHVPNGQLIQQASDTRVCNLWNSYCLGARFEFELDADTVNQTSALFPVYILTVQTGKQDRWTADRWFFNDRGYAYPMLTDTRGSTDIIPFRFPSLGWYICEDTTVYGACSRGSSFPDQVRRRYTLNNWPIPSPGVVHHITPLQYGGSDRQLPNGVIIAPDDHDFFTYRFFTSAFRPRVL